MAERWAQLGNGYDVSSYGRVRRSFDTKSGHGTYPGKIMKLVPTRDGYLAIVCAEKPKRKRYLIHVLVAEKFVGHRPHNKQVNHKDLDKQNNHWRNLEYVTNSQNILHALKHGVLFGSKITAEDVLKIRKLYAKGYTQRRIARKFNSTQSVICDIVNGIHKAWVKQAA